METVAVDFMSRIAPAFRRAHKDIVESRDTDPLSPTYGMPLREYWFRGGRGSTKSSFISLEIVRHMVENPKSNAVVFMRIAENIRDSVYKQINWAIDKLELNAFFKCTTSPFKCVYSRTQNFSASSPDMQEIIFRGLDKAGKIKGIKPTRGYFDQIWFEELTEFNGMEDCRSVIQSVLRSGDTDQEDGSAVRTWEFYSYNPPPTIANWVNLEASEPTRGRKVYESNYMNVPPGWLGKDFIERANILLEKNPRAYAHEYLGWITGTGGNIFNNLEIREIPDEEWTTQFNNRCFGIDWGFARDPFVWLAMNFDRDHNTLYIFDEIVALGKRTQETAELVKRHMAVVGGNLPIYADCAEPDSIADYNNWGVRVEGAPKPHGLKWSGRDYEFKALQDLDKIVIDKTHCPYTAKEFQRLEYPKNGSGEFISEYPHSDPGDACAVGSTLVSTPWGSVPIKHLVGLRGILNAYNEETGGIEEAEFCNVRMTRRNAEIVRVRCDGGHGVVCTPDHRIHTLNRGWVKAEDLVCNDDVNVLGKPKRMIAVEPMDHREDVYDLEVPRLHNFIVNTGMVIHNCRYGCFWKLRDAGLLNF